MSEDTANQPVEPATYHNQHVTVEQYDAMLAAFVEGESPAGVARRLGISKEKASRAWFKGWRHRSPEMVAIKDVVAATDARINGQIAVGRSKLDEARRELEELATDDTLRQAATEAQVARVALETALIGMEELHDMLATLGPRVTAMIRDMGDEVSPSRAVGMYSDLVRAHAQLVASAERAMVLDRKRLGEPEGRWAVAVEGIRNLSEEQMRERAQEIADRLVGLRATALQMIGGPVEDAELITEEG